jgi:hypothetical protein
MALFISNWPSSHNWADDDEDEFDLDAWKANADTSAPTIDDLGPLQRASAAIAVEDEYEAKHFIQSAQQKPSTYCSSKDHNN